MSRTKVLLLALLLFNTRVARAETPPTSSVEGLQETSLGDETVIFLPSFGEMLPDGKVRVRLRAWVFEKEANSLLRKGLIAALQKALGKPRSKLEAKNLEHRLRLFMVDNERNKTVRLPMKFRTFTMPKTKANGRSVADIELRRIELGGSLQNAANGRMTVRAPFAVGDIKGHVETPILSAMGISVISDIDDTIKVSEVLDRKALLQNTFLKTFRATSGLPRAFADWYADTDVSFHYVSASPWQLYPELEGFLQAAGFPAGAFHLREVRVKDPRSIEQFLTGSRDHKMSAIRSIIRNFPDRRLVLVGDSSESDPEIYGRVARLFRGRVRAIFIRAVPSSDFTDTRLADAFRGLPRTLWHVFSDGSELPRKLEDL
jgi:hypothetical protein